MGMELDLMTKSHLRSLQDIPLSSTISKLNQASLRNMEEYNKRLSGLWTLIGRESDMR